MTDCIEFQAICRFFRDEHLATRQVEGEDRIKVLKPFTWHSGGRVPDRILYREDNRLLLQVDISPVVDIFYTALKHTKVNSLVRTKYKNEDPWKKLPYINNIGIRLIPKVIHACEHRGISQNCAPGILLLYLEHCEGCSWRHLIPYILNEKQSKINMLKSKGKEIKLDMDDWTERMIESVRSFAQVSKKIR